MLSFICLNLAAVEKQNVLFIITDDLNCNIGALALAAGLAA
ncbi:MAG: hypothetical protein ACKVI3_17595 [Verrucomicrobiia bacterium]|tara:strand:+ start:1674 stop:1796 length:123 start_codon:yes stop_codon:yes gene_type:complete